MPSARWSGSGSYVARTSRAADVLLLIPLEQLLATAIPTAVEATFLAWRLSSALGRTTDRASAPES